MLLATLSGKRRTLRISLAFATTFLLLAVGLSWTPPRAGLQAEQAATESNADQPRPETVHLFTNSAPIVIADRASSTSPPGLPNLYPSTINVFGLVENIVKIRVFFSITSTFTDDLDVLLVGPNGVRSLVMSDAGGSQDHNAVSFTWDQFAAQPMPDTPTAPMPPGTFRPTNYAGQANTEPMGRDNFPAPGPGQLNYNSDFFGFELGNPNGTWSLYVVDDQSSDLNSLPLGWSLEITTGTTTGCVSEKRPVDFDGDGRSDYAVLRDIAGQKNWFTLINGGPFVATQWGMPLDIAVPADYDGDGRSDIAVYRRGPESAFFILQSATNTLRAVVFGIFQGDPSVVGDYDGDGKADPAIYRQTLEETNAWHFLESHSGVLRSVYWGSSGDQAIPGDWDGDHKYDFAVKRFHPNDQISIYRKFSGGGIDEVFFGLFQDIVVPGYYDGDCKQDIAVVRRFLVPSMTWYILHSQDQSLRSVAFGTTATDYPTQGDFDGDGKIDVAVYRNSGTFFFLRSTNNALGVVQWGMVGDYPVVDLSHQ